MRCYLTYLPRKYFETLGNADLFLFYHKVCVFCKKGNKSNVRYHD